MIAEVHELVVEGVGEAGHVIGGASEEDGGDLARSTADGKNPAGENAWQGLGQDNTQDGFELGRTESECAVSGAEEWGVGDELDGTGFSGWVVGQGKDGVGIWSGIARFHGEAGGGETGVWSGGQHCHMRGVISVTERQSVDFE